MSDEKKTLEELEQEYKENEITDKEYEEEKAKLQEELPNMSVKNPVVSEKVNQPKKKEKKAKATDDPQIKLLKNIRNLLIALVVIVALGFSFIVGYVIYVNVSASGDYYYDDSGYEDYFDDYYEEGVDEEGELSEEGEIAY